MANILVCDDDTAILEAIQFVLEDKGYTVETLTHYSEIWNKIDKFHPDIILLDLWMPEISGEVVAKKIKSNKNYQEIPIIIVSASKDTAKVALKSGADGYLCKPFDIYKLEQIIEKNLYKTNINK